MIKYVARELPEVTIISMTDEVVIYLNQFGSRCVMPTKMFHDMYVVVG